jgi:hypothetical protein
MITYYFNHKTYRQFADMARAYMEEKGYPPTLAYLKTRDNNGWHLYYQ